MIRRASTKKTIAIFFLGLMTLETLVPLKGLALTSGPVQPEATQFQPAGMSDMVDLFTGDFKYNIPLLDVDGYPVNLNYSQGVGMDDEASWVGLGWNLNVGAVTRQLRGIPDDHNGDAVVSNHHMKPKVTIGGRVMARVEGLGNEVFKVGGSLTAGIFYDNYTGYGAEAGYGGNAGVSLTGKNAGGMTAGLNYGANSSTSGGVSTTRGASLSLSRKTTSDLTTSASLSLTQGYNTREGMKSLTLGASYGIAALKGEDSDRGGGELGSASWSYNTPVFYPDGEIAFKSRSHTFSVDVGFAAFGAQLAAGTSGYKTTREVKDNQATHNAYGSLYAFSGKDNPNALMDFMREKDNIIIPDMRHIGLPIATPDIYAFTGQAGSGQFKVNGNGSGVFFNNQKVDVSDNSTFGTDYGTGAYFHGGTSLYDQNVKDVATKWTNDNQFLGFGDYPEPDPGKKDEERTYFKVTGEPTVENRDFLNNIANEEAVSIPISKKMLQGGLKSAGGNVSARKYRKSGRQIRNTAVQYLTADEATSGGLEKKIKTYTANRFGSFTVPVCHKPVYREMYRQSGIRKNHHISEISMVGQDGRRMVYGIPVYNNTQREITFAAHRDSVPGFSGRSHNEVRYALSGNQIVHKHAGTDEYFMDQAQPSYSTAHLLTAVLSADYVDLKGDGVTDDDPGSAIKFNYTRADSNFKWRTPFNKNMATLNRGNLADPDDDKGNVVYGEKELWYLHSIETKTHIAYFITEDRRDAYGVLNLHGGVDSTRKQRCLREIRLYSKSDVVKPIKTVHLKYRYTLCPGVPNSSDAVGKGKLTLDEVYFTYGNSSRGSHHFYKFHYNMKVGVPGSQTDSIAGNYKMLASDRWGSYKRSDGSPGGMLNDEYPYADSLATLPGMWALKKIDLPTGGSIEINYENDTYSYVQNRQVMRMQNWPVMLNASGAETTDFMQLRKFKIRNSFNATNLEEFKERYLSGSKYLYGKIYVNVSDEPSAAVTDRVKYDWVPCYAEVTSATKSGSDIIVDLAGSTVDGRYINPFTMAAWQRMRLDYPRYAYPGFKNKIPDDQPVSAAMKALVDAVGNFKELKADFNERGLRKGFAAKVDLTKSFVRLSCFNKTGGGTRVKNLVMREIWDEGPEEVSIQQYTYTTLSSNGDIISSGVASYEPAVGGDENPWRQPDPYTQVNRKALNNEFYLEEPFGESVFPSPVVGYSEVRVEQRSSRDDAGKISQTGYLQHEFFTAKDFPTEVVATNLDKHEKSPSGLSSFFGARLIYELTMSQGYMVRLNNMHGQVKAERVFNQAGKEISSSEYFYNSEERGGYQRLSNKVDVVNEKGVITKDEVLGREVDMFVDLREGETSNLGISLNVGIDLIPVLNWVLPLPHFPNTANFEYRLFRSASVLKTVQYTGILRKVVKKQDGSSVSAENLLYDSKTGVPVVTSSTNEFGDPVYSLSMPAYWMYDRMGHAYRNANLILEKLQTDQNGVVLAPWNSYLTPGDELIDLQTVNRRYWAVHTPGGVGAPSQLRLIDVQGKVVKDIGSGQFKVSRSGYRNQTSAIAGTIVSLTKPYDDLRLTLPTKTDLTSLQVLDAKGVLYAEAWGRPASCKNEACPEGWVLSVDGLQCLQPAGVNHNVGFYNRIGHLQNEGTAHRYARYPKLYNGASTTPESNLNGSFWNSGNGGRLIGCAIWPFYYNSGPGDNDNGKFFKMTAYFNVPAAKNYYVGACADDEYQVIVNNVQYQDSEADWEKNREYWRVRRIPMTEGWNRIDFLMKNYQGDHGAGFEIYDVNNEAELLSGTGIKVIFSSLQAIESGQPYYAFEMNEGATAVDAVRYYCGATNNSALVTGPIPHCAFVPVGSCPPGYQQTPDGQTCYKSLVFNPADSMSLVAASANFEAITATYTWNKAAAILNASGGLVYERTNYFRFGTQFQPGLSPKIGFPGIIRNEGVWINDTLAAGEKLTFRTCLEVDSTMQYYIGYTASRNIIVKIDNVVIDNVPTSQGAYRNSSEWYYLKPITLSKGPHLLEVTAEAANSPSVPSIMAVELYKQPLEELQYSNESMPPYWKIRDVLGSAKPYDMIVTALNGSVRRRYNCGGIAPDMCNLGTDCGTLPMSRVINPYLTGHLGNWLPWQEYTYLTDRKTTADYPKDGLRKAGQYAAFMPFWQYNGTTQRWDPVTEVFWYPVAPTYKLQRGTTYNWVAARTITTYDRYSQEQENMNALGQFSSARFGFKGSLPVMVGSNAKSRELYYDGFEDYKFTNLCGSFVYCLGDDFDVRNLVGSATNTWLADSTSHTGKYSLRLTTATPVTLRTQAYYWNHTPGSYIETNNAGEYTRKPQGWLNLYGFNPQPDSTYLMSVWVRDNAPNATTFPLKVSLDGKNVPGTFRAKVEQWKLVEFTLDMKNVASSNMRQFPLALTTTANIFIDDMRIFPIRGQAVTYAYDESTLRLMAELDANNFATLYEYDEQGGLIRLKKETEKGIITIKENRSSYIKKTRNE